MVSPAGLGQVNGLVPGPVLGDQLGADPEGPGTVDALDGDVLLLLLLLGQNIAVVAES